MNQMDEGLWHRQEVTITNPLGLHLRPVERLVTCAQKFQATVRISHGDKQGDGKSILDIMVLGAGPGAKIVIEAQGVDAPEALEALAALVRSDFQDPVDSSG